MTSTEIWCEISISIGTSILILVFLYFLRPRINICDHIAFDNGIYRFKVINKSRLFKLIDVSVELVQLSYSGTIGGNNVNMRDVKLLRKHIWYISAREFKDNKNNHAPYAILFGTDEDLKSLLNQGNGVKLHFKVIARHGLSGLPKVKWMEYHGTSCIKDGKFKFGNTMEILP